MSSVAARTAMIPAGRQVRAYFAPYDPVADQPTIFDPGKDGGFLLEAPPAPWLDLGWIENFRRTTRTTVQAICAGAKGAVAGQFRKGLEAGVEFDFRQWGKLQMALAGGSQHMNVLASDPSSTSRPSGGIPRSGVAVLAGSTASELVLGAGATELFAVGDMVAVDVDYQQQTGWVGTGIAAAYVKDPGDVLRDRDYVRRVTFNVARIAEKTTTSILLAQALPGGVPADGASVQKVAALVDREGGSFFQEWSGLFVWEGESGGRICFYYPRLSANRPAGMAGTHAETASAFEGTLGTIALHASFEAFPSVDTNDGEAALCYRSYIPAAMAALY